MNPRQVTETWTQFEELFRVLIADGKLVEAPLPLYEGVSLGGPDFKQLNDNEWTQIEAHYGRPLDGPTRERLNNILFQCAFDTHRARLGIRRKEVRARVKKFHDGLLQALKAFDYPATELKDGMERVTWPFPIGWLPSQPGYQAWATLREGGVHEPGIIANFTEDGASVSEGLMYAPNKLHALLHLAQYALDSWALDLGGAVRSGDLNCIRSIRKALTKAGLPAGYSTWNGEGSFGGLDGALPVIVRELHALRPNAFRSGEQSQFAKLIKQSGEPNPGD